VLPLVLKQAHFDTCWVFGVVARVHPQMQLNPNVLWHSEPPTFDAFAFESDIDNCDCDCDCDCDCTYNCDCIDGHNPTLISASAATSRAIATLPPGRNRLVNLCGSL
jgi:hypothetical protein